MKKKSSLRQRYRIANWKEYNRDLKKRGSLEVWISNDIQKRWYAKPTGKKGAPIVYSDFAIQIVLTLGKVFHQKLRQTQGFAESIVKMMGMNLSVPDYTTLSRRGETMRITIPKKEKEKIILIVDSTGLKVFGEGEWKVRRYGYTKRRTWRKLHIGIDRDGEIRAVSLTTNGVSDGEEIGNLLQQESEKIDKVIGDGGFDTKPVYEKCWKKGVRNIIIPPQRNAKIIKHGNSNGPPHPRDEHLRKIRKTSRKQWKKDVGYHTRSLVETAMFRIKTIFGGTLMARKIENQISESFLICSALNSMTALGMPKSYKIV